MDFHFWREHIGGCRTDGLEIGRQEAGTGVQVSDDRTQAWVIMVGYTERERWVIYDGSDTKVVVEGAPGRR